MRIQLFDRVSYHRNRILTPIFVLIEDTPLEPQRATQSIVSIIAELHRAVPVCALELSRQLFRNIGTDKEHMIDPMTFKSVHSCLLSGCKAEEFPKLENAPVSPGNELGGVPIGETPPGSTGGRPA